MPGIPGTASDGNRSFDVVCLGIVVADHVCAPAPRFPEPGGLVLTPSMHVTVGGCAANVAVDLAVLGHRIGIVGRVGADPFGHFLRDTLQSANVECAGLQAHPNTHTSATMIVNIGREDRRFIHSIGANAELTVEAVPEELLHRTRILYVGGFGLLPGLTSEGIRSLFEHARRLDVVTVLDVVLESDGTSAASEAAWQKVRPVLPFTDLFVPNSDEARLLLGKGTLTEHARTFHAEGAGQVIVTDGERGAVLCSDEGTIEFPARPVEVVDGTGSGDAFTAGYLHGLLTGQPSEVCLRYGTAAGANCVQTVGATDGALTAAQLEALGTASE